MAMERTGRRELAELVADHVFRHGDGHVLVTVVDAESQADELRQDRRTTAPDLDHVGAARATCGLGLLQQIAVDERALPNGTRHGLALLLAGMPRGNDEFVGRLVRPRLLALGRLAPRTDRMTTARSAAFAAAVRMVDRVHGDAAIVRTMPEPTVAPGLADRNVHVIRVRHRADRAEALAVDQALLARLQAQDDVTLVATDDLRVRPEI